MQRQRAELVPVAEVLSDLGGPVKALRETPPPAQRGFTLADQVNQLVSASEADPYSRLHGANDGALLVAPQQPRQPASVQTDEWPLHAGNDRGPR